MRDALPELGLPAFDDDQLQELLAELCPGRRSFADLRTAPWLDAIQARLTPVQRQAVNREAPEFLTVPSGSRLGAALRAWPAARAQVRIQEIFGWKETPRVAAGRVRVLLRSIGPQQSAATSNR